MKLYLKTMDNQLSNNYSVTSIKICHIVCALNIFLFFLNTCKYFSSIYKDLIFYILMCAYHFIYSNKIKPPYSIRIFYGVPNLAFYIKCYNLPFFGWRYGNVDNYSLNILIFCACNLMSQYVQNYRPTHEQTRVLP